MVKFSLFLHIVSAIFWIGGMLFLTLVIVPFLNMLKDPKEKSMVYRAIGPKYRKLAWIAIIILCITGPINLKLMGFSPSSLIDPAFYSTPFGKAVGVKLFFVALIIISCALHDFWVGPKARTSDKFKLYARIFGRGNLLLALIIVILAVIVRSGGF